MNRNTDRLMRDYLSRTESGDRRSDRRRDDREDERRMNDRRMNDRNDYEYDREDDYEDGRRRRNSRGQFTDRHYESESSEREGHLSRSDMRKWSSHLKNKDGTRGAHFDREPVRELTEKMKIEFDEYTFDELLMTMNMLYSDYCKAIRINEMEMQIAKYIELAQAFLEDDDGYMPSDKLTRYYCFVVPHD